MKLIEVLRTMDPETLLVFPGDVSLWDAENLIASIQHEEDNGLDYELCQGDVYEMTSAGFRNRIECETFVNRDAAKARLAKLEAEAVR